VGGPGAFAAADAPATGAGGGALGAVSLGESGVGGVVAGDAEAPARFTACGSTGTASHSQATAAVAATASTTSAPTTPTGAPRFADGEDDDRGGDWGGATAPPVRKVARGGGAGAARDPVDRDDAGADLDVEGGVGAAGAEDAGDVVDAGGAGGVGAADPVERGPAHGASEPGAALAAAVVRGEAPGPPPTSGQSSIDRPCAVQKSRRLARLVMTRGSVGLSTAVAIATARR
jgi:hypothetical protein